MKRIRKSINIMQIPVYTTPRRSFKAWLNNNSVISDYWIVYEAFRHVYSWAYDIKAEAATSSLSLHANSFFLKKKVIYLRLERQRKIETWEKQSLNPSLMNFPVEVWSRSELHMRREKCKRSDLISAECRWIRTGWKKQKIKRERKKRTKLKSRRTFSPLLFSFL